MLDSILAKTSLSAEHVTRLHGQAQELEGVFLNTLVKEMFAGLNTDNKAFGGGFAEETWRSMQAEQYSDAMAKSGGIGLSDQLLGDLIKMQEAQQTNQTITGVYR